MRLFGENFQKQNHEGLGSKWWIGKDLSKGKKNCIYWISVVSEAKSVIDNRLNEVSIKYRKYHRFIDQHTTYCGDIKRARDTCVEKSLDNFFRWKIYDISQYFSNIFKISNPLTILPNDPTPEMLPTDDTKAEISPKSSPTIIIVNFLRK